MKVPRDLKPYFEFAYVFGFPFCDYCGAEPMVVSDSPRHSDPWYLDAATAMKLGDWVVPEVHAAACPSCAKARNLRHDAAAFSVDL